MKLNKCRMFMRKLTRFLTKFIAIASIIGGIIWVHGYFFVYATVNESCTIEAGSEIQVSDFGKLYVDNTVFVESTEDIDTSIPGSYLVYVKNTFFTHECQLIVEDTIAPSAVGVEIDWSMDANLTPEVCVSDANDVTDLTYEFIKTIDQYSYDTQEVWVRITDMGGNFIDVSSTVRLVPLTGKIVLEVGEELPSETDFLLDQSAEYVCLTDLTVIDNMKPQEVTVEYDMYGQIVTSTLVIQDSVAPQGDAIEQTGYFTSPQFDVYDFVENIVDMTEVTATLESEIDYNSGALQEILVTLVDEGGNVTEINSTLLLAADTTAPVISCSGGSIESPVGDSIAYRQSISATDNCDESITVDIDNSNVDIDTIGTYTVYCTATDVAGNTATKNFTVSIYKPLTVAEEVDLLAAEVLADIIDNSMSQYEKVEAIYWYCKNNISYIGYSDKSSYTMGAYEGLKYHKGDCFTYAATAKVLLTKAGIANMDISKIPAATQHFWNLVDIGDGWMHFDSCARADGTIIFMWTTEEVLAYSNSHNLTHNFDPASYPQLYE